MWSPNTSDKPASLGSMAEEESEACNCNCFYQVLPQPSLNSLALCTCNKACSIVPAEAVSYLTAVQMCFKLWSYMYYSYSLTFPFLTSSKIWGDWTWHTQHRMTKWKLLCNFTCQEILQAQTSLHRRLIKNILLRLKNGSRAGQLKTRSPPEYDRLSWGQFVRTD